jgi:MFS family permease
MWNDHPKGYAHIKMLPLGKTLVVFIFHDGRCRLVILTPSASGVVVMKQVPAPANEDSLDIEHEGPKRDASTVKSRWFILGILVLARMTVAFQFQSVAAVGPLLIHELAIDYAMLGLIIGLYMLPGVAIALPAGLFGQRYGDKRIALLGLVLMTFGGFFMGLTADATLFAAGRVVSGIGAILLNVLLTKMVADWFASRDTTVAMSFLLSGWPIGIGLALVILAPIGEATGGALPMLMTAMISALVLILILAFYHSPLEAPKGSGTFRIGLSGNEWTLCLLAGLVWSCLNVGFTLVLAFGPSFLAELHYSLAEAGFITSTAMWTMVPALIFGGYIAERVAKPNVLMTTCFLLSALVILSFASGFAPIIWCALLGVLLLPAGLIMKMLVTSLIPKNRAIGIGVFLSCYYGIMAVSPLIAGVLRESTGSSAAPLWLASGMYLAAALFLGAFRIAQLRLSRVV